MKKCKSVISYSLYFVAVYQFLLFCLNQLVLPLWTFTFKKHTPPLAYDSYDSIYMYVYFFMILYGRLCVPYPHFIYQHFALWVSVMSVEKTDLTEWGNAHVAMF